MKTKNNPITESTELQAAPKVRQEETSSRLWQSVLVGGVPGILIGAGVTSAVAKSDPAGNITEPVAEDAADANGAVAEIQVADSVNDDMSFSEAFAAARNEVGPGGAFVWHGHVYGTYRADDPEWQEMSADDRAEHSQAIIAQVHPAPYTPTEHEPPIVEVNEGVTENGTEAVSVDNGGDNGTEEVDVHVIEDIYQGQTEDGTLVTVGVGHVNGHHAEFVDTDGDGEVDTVLLDANDNQVLDDSEMQSTSGMGITVDDLVSDMQANNATAVDDALYGNMPDYTNDTPDYTNDADTSNFC